MGIDRRTFLKGLLAASVAPAIVKAENIMPVRPLKEPDIWVPNNAIITFDDTVVGKDMSRVVLYSDTGQIIAWGDTTISFTQGNRGELFMNHDPVTMKALRQGNATKVRRISEFVDRTDDLVWPAFVQEGTDVTVS